MVQPASLLRTPQLQPRKGTWLLVDTEKGFAETMLTEGY